MTRYIVFPRKNFRVQEDDVARGSTGAPRNTPDPDVPASGGDIRTAQTQDTQERGARHRQTRPGGPQTSPDQDKPGKPRGISRVIAFICGRRTKWVIVAFWILVLVALGGLAGKLQGAEKNDASSYLPASAESTQELNQQNLFQPRTRWWTGYGPRCTGSRAPMPRWAAAPPSIRMSRAPR